MRIIAPISIAVLVASAASALPNRQRRRGLRNLSHTTRVPMTGVIWSPDQMRDLPPVGDSPEARDRHSRGGAGTGNAFVDAQDTIIKPAGAQGCQSAAIRLGDAGVMLHASLAGLNAALQRQQRPRAVRFPAIFWERIAVSLRFALPNASSLALTICPTAVRIPHSSRAGVRCPGAERRTALS